MTHAVRNRLLLSIRAGLAPLLAIVLLSGCNGGDDTAPTTITQPPPPPPPPPPPDPFLVTATVTGNDVVLANGLVERRWSRQPFRTQSFKDLRDARTWTENSADFALVVGGQELPSDQLEVLGDPQVESIADGGVRVTLDLAPAATSAFPVGLRVVRTLEMYPHIAGLRQETRVESPVPLVVTGYALDQAQVAGAGLVAQMHSFRAGADWREPEWTGPPLVIGDPMAGDWRASRSGPTVSGTAQWLSVADDHDHRLFYVIERNDYASSVTSFDGARARAGVDFGRDVIYLGPLEESGHAGNPSDAPVRQRVVTPAAPLRLEPVFTGVALDADDEPWQHYQYLAGRRMPPYRREITFNSNGTDANRISTGAKDDMDFATFQSTFAIAQRLGIETFVFDDGWQARSGDWCPDADVTDPRCIEPRRGTDPKFAPRFPDATFAAVHALLDPAGMHLGLWMSPLHFNPSAVAFQQNPEWTCQPIDEALLAEQESDPYGGSNEAGILQWNPEAMSANGRMIDYLEARIREPIEQWGVRYFKFDFTAWLDCAGVAPVDIYAYRESFMAMLDRILADHPDVTIQMDETNDYRLFPFEALVRGPTWYQNGSPTPAEALHANWVLTPYLPPFALGRSALRTGDLDKYPVDFQMQVALLSHMSFFNDLTRIPEAAIAPIRVWTDYYRAHRTDFAAFTYPLLGEDPITGDDWAAFQTWDPGTGRGALLVYRQDATDDHRLIRLRNVAPGMYRLIEAPTDTHVIAVTGAELSAGIDVSIESRQAGKVFRIERVAP